MKSLCLVVVILSAVACCNGIFLNAYPGFLGLEKTIPIPQVSLNKGVGLGANGLSLDKHIGLDFGHGFNLGLNFGKTLGPGGLGLRFGKNLNLGFLNLGFNKYIAVPLALNKGFGFQKGINLG